MSETLATLNALTQQHAAHDRMQFEVFDSRLIAMSPADWNEYQNAVYALFDIAPMLGLRVARYRDPVRCCDVFIVSRAA